MSFSIIENIRLLILSILFSNFIAHVSAIPGWSLESNKELINVAIANSHKEIENGLPIFDNDIFIKVKDFTKYDKSEFPSGYEQFSSLIERVEAPLSRFEQFAKFVGTIEDMGYVIFDPNKCIYAHQIKSKGLKVVLSPICLLKKGDKLPPLSSVVLTHYFVNNYLQSACSVKTNVTSDRNELYFNYKREFAALAGLMSVKIAATDKISGSCSKNLFYALAPLVNVDNLFSNTVLEYFRSPIWKYLGENQESRINYVREYSTNPTEAYFARHSFLSSLDQPTSYGVPKFPRVEGVSSELASAWEIGAIDGKHGSTGRILSHEDIFVKKYYGDFKLIDNHMRITHNEVISNNLKKVLLPIRTIESRTNESSNVIFESLFHGKSSVKSLKVNRYVFRSITDVLNNSVAKKDFMKVFIDLANEYGIINTRELSVCVGDVAVATVVTVDEDYSYNTFTLVPFPAREVCHFDHSKALKNIYLRSRFLEGSSEYVIIPTSSYKEYFDNDLNDYIKSIDMEPAERKFVRQLYKGIQPHAVKYNASTLLSLKPIKHNLRYFDIRPSTFYNSKGSPVIHVSLLSYKTFNNFFERLKKFDDYLNFQTVVRVSNPRHLLVFEGVQLSGFDEYMSLLKRLYDAKIMFIPYGSFDVFSGLLIPLDEEFDKDDVLNEVRLANVGSILKDSIHKLDVSDEILACLGQFFLGVNNVSPISMHLTLSQVAVGAVAAVSLAHFPPGSKERSTLVLLLDDEPEGFFGPLKDLWAYPSSRPTFDHVYENRSTYKYLLTDKSI